MPPTNYLTMSLFNALGDLNKQFDLILGYVHHKKKITFPQKQSYSLPFSTIWTERPYAHGKCKQRKKGYSDNHSQCLHPLERKILGLSPKKQDMM